MPSCRLDYQECVQIGKQGLSCRGQTAIGWLPVMLTNQCFTSMTQAMPSNGLTEKQLKTNAEKSPVLDGNARLLALRSSSTVMASTTGSSSPNRQRLLTSADADKSWKNNNKHVVSARLNKTEYIALYEWCRKNNHSFNSGIRDLIKTHLV